MSIGSLAGCVSAGYDNSSDIKNDAISSGNSSSGQGVAPPASGYIVYVGVKGAFEYNLYKQEMNGTNPVGSPTVVYQDGSTIDNVNDARYPQITKDGRYIIFVEREGDSVGSSFDTIEIIDHQGNSIRNYHRYNSSSNANQNRCNSINYPEILDYEYDDIGGTVEFLISSTCVTDWSNHLTIISGGSDQDTVDGLLQIPPTEFAKHPSYNRNAGGYLFTSNDTELKWVKFIHGQPGNDYASAGKVYISSSDWRNGGHCVGCPIPLPTPLKSAFAPSISPDGRYVLFNSESYKNVQSRLEELFLIDLPATDIADAFKPSNLGTTPFVSTINTLPHANVTPNSYGTFTVNGQYQYTVHDKSNGTLWIASDLTSPPVQLALPAGVKAKEAAWFYQ